MPIKPKPHHPQIPGTYHRPANNAVGYIYGSNCVAGFGCRDFYVALIPYQQAREMVVKHHYSRRFVNNSYVNLGVFIDGQILGVMQFGYTLTPKFVSKICRNTTSTQYLELNRMWLDDLAPRNSESRAISFAIKFIKRACPTIRWIQSFADERCGRLGVVYQAANFLFIGSHFCDFYELDGDTYHDMLLTTQKKGGTRGVYLRANFDRAVKRRLRQFRYIFFVQPKYRRDLVRPVLPYPKPDNFLNATEHPIIQGDA